MSKTGEFGFTLLELMVTLVVAGLLMALVPPLLDKGTDTARLGSDARRIVSALDLARSEAIAGAVETDVAFDLEHRRFGRVPGPLTGSIDDGIDVTIDVASDDRLADRQGIIRFFPEGSASGAMIALTNSAGEMRISVDWLTGRVTVARSS